MEKRIIRLKKLHSVSFHLSDRRNAKRLIEVFEVKNPEENTPRFFILIINEDLLTGKKIRIGKSSFFSRTSALKTYNGVARTASKNENNGELLAAVA